ncbi:hypothetical protein HMI54_002061 [Coelomomyces lativittatus]|nr:hypothetical protein HMI54_002061 [Coelomomyces lativittatus]
MSSEKLRCPSNCNSQPCKYKPMSKGLSMLETKKRVLSLLMNSTLSKRQQQELLTYVEKSPSHSLPTELPSVIIASKQNEISSDFRKISISNKVASGLRTKEQILRQCDFYKVEPYRTKPTRDRNKEIERFQMIMSNQSIENDLNLQRFYKEKEKTWKEDTIDPIKQLSEEIEERIEWFDQMQKLGQGKKYQSQFQYEIQIRKNELKKLQNECKKDS